MRFISILFTLIGLWLISCGPKGTSQSAQNENSYSSIDSYNRIAQTPDPNRKLENLDITLTIENAPQGTYYLMGIFAEQYFLVDSLKINGNQLTFKRNEPLEPGLYYGVYPNRSTAIQMIIDTDQTFEMSTVNGDIVGSMKVKGSQENELLYETLLHEQNMAPEFNRIAKAFEGLEVGSEAHTQLVNEHDQLMQEKMDYLRSMWEKLPQSLFTSFKEAGQNPHITYEFDANGGLSQDYLAKLRTLYWQNTNFDDKRLLRTPVISNKLVKYYGNIMPQNPDTLIKYTDMLINQCIDNDQYYKYFVNWVTLEYEPTKTTLMDAEAVYVHMITNYFTKERAFWQDSVQTYGLQLRAYEMGNSLVGQTGPNVTAQGPDGKTYSINDIKSPYVIVYMWNPDCEHCAEQTPKLVQLYNQQQNKEFEVYSIAVNTEDDKWREAIRKYQMPWINVFDPTNKAIYAKYYVDNTPEVYVLNPDRKIIGKNLKVNQIMTIVDRDKASRG
ncbi:TlpA disulfide reductase family protein [Portibacter marinus]|uniref:TlpA disulfide reductase family protein n=1 Tax=Portibacter marinus TaxID=2898660 RepID=UPI001F17386F|nr:TlpA disulfide reductase family protein [Portibacter marinus]